MEEEIETEQKIKRKKKRKDEEESPVVNEGKKKKRNKTDEEEEALDNTHMKKKKERKTDEEEEKENKGEEDQSVNANMRKKKKKKERKTDEEEEEEEEENKDEEEESSANTKRKKKKKERKTDEEKELFSNTEMKKKKKKERRTEDENKEEEEESLANTERKKKKKKKEGKTDEEEEEENNNGEDMKKKKMKKKERKTDEEEENKDEEEEESPANIDMKKKKKRKRDKKEEENKDEEQLLNTDTKKRKKRKTDEEKEESKDEEKEGTHTKRRRKESSCDSDWCVRYEENTAVIRARAKSKGERKQEEVMTRKKKKRKMEEEGTEDSECSEVYFRAKKMKKRREVEEEETSQISESSPESVKRKRDKSRGEKGQENRYSSEDHTFVMPESRVRKTNEDCNRENDRRRKEKRKADKEMRENTDSENRCSSDDHMFVMPESRTRRTNEENNREKDRRRKKTRQADKEMRENTDSDTMINEGRTERHENWRGGNTKIRQKHVEIIQERTTTDKRGGNMTCSKKMALEREQVKRKLCGGVSRIAYSGLLGWQTDTSTDNQDYCDDVYHQPTDVLRMRRRWERDAAAAAVDDDGCVIYSEGDGISGFVSHLSSSGEQEEEVQAIDIPSQHRFIPGFVVEQRNIPTLEETLYEFPPGEGIPEEEIEEVHEFEDYWKIKDKVMQMSLYTEEAKKYIDEKLKRVEGFFERLQFGHLTPADMKEKRPDNFDDPFFPTPRQLQFLDSLNIVVDWPLSDLHKYHINTYTIPSKPKNVWNALKIYVDTTRLSLRDEKILARNWFAFQKEYGFYDLRPLVSVRTARVLREGGSMTVHPYEYLSQRNKIHFLLYLAKDLPYRSLLSIQRKARKLVPFLRGRCLMRKSHKVNGLVLAKMKYVMEIFGADMLALELLVGPPLSSFYSACFVSNFLFKNVKLRLGPWQKPEDDRMLRGLQEVLKVKSFEEAYKLAKIPWLKLFPYIRTRNAPYMRRRLSILAGRKSEKYNTHVRRKEIIKLFYLLYRGNVQSFRDVDWEGLGRRVGSSNPIKLEWSFKELFMEYIPFRHRITVPEGLQYFHDIILPRYKYLVRSQEGGDSEDRQDHERDPDHPESLDLELIEGSAHGIGGDGGERGDVASRRDGDSDLRSRDEVTREQNMPGNSSEVRNGDLSDLRNRDKVIREKNSPQIISSMRRSYLNELKSTNKVTEQQNDLQDTNNSKKHTNDLSSSQATQDDLTQAGKTPLKDLDEITYIPHKHDLETINIDLSDLEEDLESDACAFEKVTFGQALGKM